MVRVKICGIQSLEEARWGVDAGTDALGFVFVPKSKRYVEPENVREITRELPPFITRVGVFVDCPPSDVANIAQISGITAIQLHGSEDPRNYVHIGLPLIKALRIKLNDHGENHGEDSRQENLQREQGSKTLELEEDWVKSVQGILIDSEYQGQFGGTGRVLPWKSEAVRQSAQRIKELGIPFILAGGLNPQNIQAGIEELTPYAVDVSSGVEEEGKKSKALIQDFIRRAKGGGN